MQYAVTAALTGDRSHQIQFRKDLKARAELTTTRMNAIDGISCVAPRSAFYAMPKVELPRGKTDTDFVLGLLRTKGVLTVYGSGFGTALEDGFFRIVFLAPLDELSAIYDDVADFTAEFRSA
jgi:aspartate/methionine/tyrosine aminotransferase